LAKDATGRKRIAKARKNDFISRVGLKNTEKYIQPTSASSFRFREASYFYSFWAGTGASLSEIDRLAGVGALQGGEAKLEGSEVVPGAMVGLTVILDGTKEFAHCPLESRLEP
jgi:hypothetical protein